MQYWLLKSEPETYAWNDLCRLKRDMWDGVRNYQARNYLKQMQIKDQALFYHSGKEKAVQGIVEIVRAYYPDPTAESPHNWVVVDVAPLRKLRTAITLQRLRKESGLKDIALLKNPRLSVQPLSQEAFLYILSMEKSGM